MHVADPCVYLLRLEIRTCDPSSFEPATSRPCFPSSSQPISTYREHTQAVSCVSVGDRGQRIASASHDGCVKLWSGGVAKSSERTLNHVGDDSWCAVLVHSVVFCDADAGAHVIASGASDGLVRLWDTRLSAPLVRAAAREDTPARSIELGCRDGHLFVGTQAGEVLLIDWRQSAAGAVVRAAPHRAAITSLALKPLAEGEKKKTRGGRLLAVASDDGNASVLCAEDLNGRAEVRGHTDTVSALGWLPSGELLSGGWDFRVLVHQIHRKEQK